MSQQPWGGEERRTFPRENATLDVHIQVEVYGFDSEARPFFCRGTTTNISRSGLLGQVNAPLNVGAICKLFFHNPSLELQPRNVCGRVTRCNERNGVFVVSVEFDEPLSELCSADMVAVVAVA